MPRHQRRIFYAQAVEPEDDEKGCAVRPFFARPISLPSLRPPSRLTIDFRLDRRGRLTDELVVMVAGISVTLLPPLPGTLEMRVHVAGHQLEMPLRRPEVRDRKSVV